MKVTVNIPVPAFVGKVASQGSSYLRQVAKEIVTTAVVAGAAAGLTVVANDVPGVASHYGLSPIFTAQIIAVVGAARAFVSGLNSVKVSPPGVAVPPAAPSDTQTGV